jgi:hypothetical protein
MRWPAIPLKNESRWFRCFEAPGIQINRCLRADLEDRLLVLWLNERYAAQRDCSASNWVTIEGQL